MKVLIAVEQAASEKEILDFIERNGWLENDDIKLMTVISPLIFAEPTLGAAEYCASFWKAAEDNAQALMTETAAHLKTKSNRRVEWQVSIGDPVQEILDAARHWHPELLVVGTHSPRGLRKFFLGSVSQAVAEKAPCSTLVLKLADAPAA